MSNNPFFSNFFPTFFWNVQERVTRKQYWMYFLVAMAYVMVLLSVVIVGKELDISRELLFGVLITGYVPIAWSGIVIGIKRIRDTGASPWFYLLQLVPYLGLIIAIGFALTPTNYFHRFRKEAAVVTA